MNYSKNLLKGRKKSTFAIVVGILFFIVAISWIPVRLTENGSVSGFDWFYMIIFLLNGLSQTMAGLGYSIDSLVGKAFIEIDNQIIRLKTGPFDKEQSITWDEIHSIDYKLNKLMITKNNRTKLNLTMSKLEYSVIQEIKNVISEIANKKEIPINLN